jgi:hypothetical protein
MPSKMFGKIKPLLLYFALIYLLFLTYLSSSWGIDPHHDGHSYLSAYLGTFNIYPPQTSNVYGIAGPFIESKILQVFSLNLVAYRYIAFGLICLSTIIIYKIISIKIDKVSSKIFALLWLSANPTWVLATKGTLGHIQVVWPNLWIQTLLLVALFLLFRKKSINSLDQIFLGIVVASLPFFRIQGIISSIILIIIISILCRKNIIYFLSSVLITILAWLLVINFNGGFTAYVKNILINPLTIEAYSQHRSSLSLLKFMLNLGKYYFVALLLLSIACILISKLKSHKIILENKFKPPALMIILIITLILLVLGNYNIWTNTIYTNLTTLLIDISVPVSLIFFISSSYNYFYRKELIRTEEDKILVILSGIVVSNLVYQYPVPDLGHRWWSSATSVLFIAYISNKNIEFNFLQKLNLKKYFLIPLSICTICFSIFQGVFFQKLESTTINDNNNALSGMRYPAASSEMILNLQKSVKVLAFLEVSQVKINYYCRDGLYYLRRDGYSLYSKKSLDIFEYKHSANIGEVSFYCNYNENQFLNSNHYRPIIIGEKRIDIFLVNKANTQIISDIEKIIMN